MKITSDKKIIILCISIILIVSIQFIYLINKVNHRRDKLESFVGKTIMIGKDTLIVTDYNGSNDTYNLSNRVIIDEDYILKNAK